LRGEIAIAEYSDSYFDDKRRNPIRRYFFDLTSYCRLPGLTPGDGIFVARKEMSTCQHWPYTIAILSLV
jgi:hypothetical protein